MEKAKGGKRKPESSSAQGTRTTGGEEMRTRQDRMCAGRRLSKLKIPSVTWEMTRLRRADVNWK